MNSKIRVLSCLSCKHYTQGMCIKYSTPNLLASDIRNDKSKCGVFGKDYEDEDSVKWCDENIYLISVVPLFGVNLNYYACSLLTFFSIMYISVPYIVRKKVTLDFCTINRLKYKHKD